MTTRPWRAARALISSMSATWPYRLTGMMARVRGVIFAARPATSRLAVSASTSAKTGTPPASTMTSAVAAKVKAVVMTSSPGRRSIAISAISSASVPLATDTQWATPARRASACSISATSGPMMYWPWSSTRCMRASMEVLRARYWACRSVNCIGRVAAGSVEQGDTLTLQAVALAGGGAAGLALAAHGQLQAFAVAAHPAGAARGHAGDQREVGHVAADHRPGADEGVPADG